MTTYLKDLLERAAATFGAGFFAALFADWTGAIPSDWKAWLLTGVVAGVLDTVKGLVSKKVGDPGTASALPRLTVGEVEPGRHLN
ncbi:hypothetical protein [Amycolatopsis thermoflava]|uniref:hypothetical protein n=1 Tax=Amycolatopsis thermoflava TaxID=84480 RepID=UPI0004203F30|nr:hypothetical protein [Amycolatopsis thermoflava]